MTQETASEATSGTVRDWRWVLGVLGKTFITLGLLMIAFVGYQLWGTGIEFRASQSELGKDFSAAVASATIPPAVSPSTQAPTSGPTVSSTLEPASTSTSPPTVMPPTTVPPRAGDVIASLEMPTISNKTLYIVSGVRTSDLKRGIGHFPDTPAPGETGNSALAGHRTTYGAPFENLDRLKTGDPLIVTTTVGDRYVYVVVSSEIVAPEAVRVLSPPPDQGDVLLTLTTCHPKRSTAKRLVVYSRLDPTQSSVPRERDTGLPVNAAPATTTPATTTPVATTPATTTPATTTPVATTPATTTPATTTPATTTARNPTPTEAAATSIATDPDDVDERSGSSDDALTAGWFHDPAAWPHILLWGALLVAIALGGRRVGLRFGRRWLGPVVAAAPFVVVLYFVFQNISRLLPPGF